jgi:putative serine protease PepD
MVDVSSHQDPDGPDDDRADDADTAPLGSSSYPPPSGQPWSQQPPRQEQQDRPPQQQPDPWSRPFGQPEEPGRTAAFPTPPPYQPPYQQQHRQQYQPPYPQPYQQPYQQQPYAAPYAGYPQQPQRPDGHRDRRGLPGWAWPVVAGIALLVGLLGGVLGGAVVSSSMNDGTSAGSVPVIPQDNGASKPLNAHNGSVAAVAARVLPSTVQVQANGGADGNAGGGATGSGFVLDDHGHVITNNHVVADATGAGELKVLDQHGTKHDAKIIGRSPVYDIAVLEVSRSKGLRPAAIGSSQNLRVGDTVVAIGSPLGLSSTVTSGIVSAVNRPVTTGDQNQSSYINAVQTDAAINPGNSGGPLVNLRGQVVGVNSAIATTGGVIGGEAGNIGVGFAIPMEQVRITAAQILATGKARYPVIGATVNTGSQKNGAEVDDVPSGTPASDAGLEKGDVVTKVDGKPVTDGIGLIVAIRTHQPGETVTLTVQRSGKERQVRIKLDSKVG